MEWEEIKKKEIVEDSKMNNDSPILTVKAPEDLGKWQKQGDNRMLKVIWKPATVSLLRLR